MFRTHTLLECVVCHVCLLCCSAWAGAGLRKVNVKTSEHFLAGKLCGAAGRAGAGRGGLRVKVGGGRRCSGLSPDTGRDTLRPPCTRILPAL